MAILLSMIMHAYLSVLPTSKRVWSAVSASLLLATKLLPFKWRANPQMPLSGHIQSVMQSATHHCLGIWATCSLQANCWASICLHCHDMRRACAHAAQ
jgi:hypothetical protein